MGPVGKRAKVAPMDEVKVGASGFEVVVALDGARPVPVAEVGGKGAHLAALVSAGVAVPPAVAVPTACFQEAVRGFFLRGGGGADDDPSFEAVRAALEAHRVPEALARDVALFFRRHGKRGGVSVRSSAKSEDSAAASFAGQFATVLNVRSAEAACDAICAVWASVFTDATKTYLGQRGGVQEMSEGQERRSGAVNKNETPPTTTTTTTTTTAAAKKKKKKKGDLDLDRICDLLAMGVVLQEQLDSAKAGVLFTTNPRTGAADEMVLEAVLGQGEGLVSGQVTPDFCWVRVDDGEEKKTPPIKKMSSSSAIFDVAPTTTPSSQRQPRTTTTTAAVTTTTKEGSSPTSEKSDGEGRHVKASSASSLWGGSRQSPKGGDKKKKKKTTTTKKKALLHVSFLRERAARKVRALYADPSAGGTRVVDVSRKKFRRVLSRAEVRRLCCVGRAIADFLGHPCDVEWAFDRRGKLWVLQARSITRTEAEAAAAAPYLAPWAAPDAALWERDAHVVRPLPPMRERGWPDLAQDICAVALDFGVAMENIRFWCVNGIPYISLVPLGAPTPPPLHPPPGPALFLLSRLDPNHRAASRRAARHLRQAMHLPKDDVSKEGHHHHQQQGSGGDVNKEVPQQQQQQQQPQQPPPLLSGSDDAPPWVLMAREWRLVERPRRLAVARDLRTVDPAKLTDVKLVDHLRVVAGAFADAWRSHGRYTPPCMIPFSLFVAEFEQFGIPALDLYGLTLDQHACWAQSPARPLWEVFQGDRDGAAVADRLEAVVRMRDDAQAFQAVKMMTARGDALGDACQAYCAEVQDRITGGYDFSSTTPREEPLVLVEMLYEAATRGPPPPGEDVVRRKIKAVRDRVPEKPPKLRRLFDRLLGHCREVSPMRDQRGYDNDAHVNGIWRRATREAGARLEAAGRVAHADDALWVDSVDDIADLLLVGKANVHPSPAVALTLHPISRWERVAAKAHALRLRAGHFVASEDAPQILNCPTSGRPADPDFRRWLPSRGSGAMTAHFVAGYRAIVDDDVEAMEAHNSDLGGAKDGDPGKNVFHLRGHTASAGIYEGRARVMPSFTDYNALEPGEVAVLPMTSASFNAYLGRCGAIVSDSGGVLCHAALCAREVGLPAVVGCAFATTRINTGDRVRVDGDNGIVTKLENSESDNTRMMNELMMMKKNNSSKNDPPGLIGGDEADPREGGTPVWSPALDGGAMPMLLPPISLGAPPSSSSSSPPPPSSSSSATSSRPKSLANTAAPRNPAKMRTAMGAVQQSSARSGSARSAKAEAARAQQHRQLPLQAEDDAESIRATPI